VSLNLNRDDVKHLARRAFWIIPSEPHYGKSNAHECGQEIKLLSWIIESIARSPMGTQASSATFSVDLAELAPLNNTSGVTPDHLVDFPLQMTFTEVDGVWSCRFPLNESGDFCLVEGVGKVLVRYSTLQECVISEQLQPCHREFLFQKLSQLNKALDAYCRLTRVSPCLRSAVAQAEDLDVSNITLPVVMVTSPSRLDGTLLRRFLDND
jgi:hypothetical protein